MDKAYFILGLFIFNLTLTFLVVFQLREVSHHMKDVDQAIQSLEGKLSLHEGKAILSSGRTCLINEKGLESEDLAINLVRACFKQFQAEAQKQEQEDSSG